MYKQTRESVQSCTVRRKALPGQQGSYSIEASVPVLKEIMLPMSGNGSRVGNGISFRKNSAEQTRNVFRYSAEENAHSEGIPKFTEEPIPKLGTERNYAKKNQFYETAKIAKQNDLSVPQSSIFDNIQKIS